MAALIRKILNHYLGGKTSAARPDLLRRGIGKGDGSAAFGSLPKGGRAGRRIIFP